MRACSSADIGASITFMPSAAEPSAMVPSVGFNADFSADDRAVAAVNGDSRSRPRPRSARALVWTDDDRHWPWDRGWSNADGAGRVARSGAAEFGLS